MLCFAGCLGRAYLKTLRRQSVLARNTLLAFFQHPVKGHTAAVYSAAWSPNGAFVASGGGFTNRKGEWVSDDSIRLWDVRSQEQIRELVSRDLSTVYALAFSHGGTRLISGSDARDYSDGASLRVWDTQAGKEVCQLGTGRTTIHSLSLAHDEDTLAAATLPLPSDAGVASSVRAFSLRKECELKSLERAGIATSIKFIPGTRDLIVAGEEGVEIWDCDSGVRCRRYQSEELIWINSIDVSQDGRYLACGCGGQDANYRASRFRVVVLDLRSGRVEEMFSHQRLVHCVAFCLGDSSVIGAGAGGELRNWKLGEKPKPDKAKAVDA